MKIIKRDTIRRAGLMAVCIITAVSILGLTACGENDDLYSELDLNEYLKVPEYKGLEAEKIKVSKSELGDAIYQDLKDSSAEKQLDKGDKVKEGDTVIIDYVGKVDGKEFEGGTATEQELTLGSGAYIDGFEEGLVGHRVGDKNIKLELAFPLNYNAEELQGKDVEFTVNIKDALRTEAPEYNDDFVKTLGDYKNTKEYEKAVEERLYEQKEADQKTELWSEVLGKTKVKKYPKEIVNHYIDIFDKQIDYYSDQRGLDRTDFIGQYYGVVSEDELHKQLKDSARVLVKQEMLIEYIAAREGLTYTSDEAKAFKENIVRQGFDDESVLRETGRTMKQYVHIELLYENVRDFLLENADIK